jgi:predicted nucleic-acid-binding protein
VLAVDTNVVVRLVTNDDRTQVARAKAVFAANDIFVPKTVLLETEWVLRFTYELDRPAIIRGLRGVLGMANVTGEDGANVARALDWYEGGLDLADALHLSASGDAKRFATFDARLVKRAKGLATIEVVAV